MYMPILLTLLFGLAPILGVAYFFVSLSRRNSKRNAEFERFHVHGEVLISSVTSQTGAMGRGWQTYFLDVTVEAPGIPPQRAYFDVDVEDFEANKIVSGARFPARYLDDLSTVRMYVRPNEPEKYLELELNLKGHARP